MAASPALVLLLGALLAEVGHAAGAPLPALPAAGAAVNGLGCRIEIPRAVRQGDYVRVVLTLPYQASRGFRTFRRINLPANECAFLEFRDAGGRVHARWPASSGLPVSPGYCGEDMCLDQRAPAAGDTLIVPLLSNKGQQLAPGEYDVTAIYSNERPRGFSSRLDDIEPETLWWGSVRSAAVPVRVVAAAPRPDSLTAFYRLERFRRDGRWEWRPAAASARVIHVTVRPGYYVGHRVEVYRGAENVPSGGGLADNLDVFNESGFILAPTDTVRVRFTAFETSEGTPHLWMPEAGDYREFWSREFWSYPTPH